MSILGAGIAAGASLISSGIGAMSQGKMNRRGERFARDMWDKQGQREQDFWHMQNQYNLPENQMKRLKDGGLNPHLMYGQGTSALTADQPKAGGAPSTPNFKAIDPQLGSVVQQALSAESMKAGIDRTKAETAAISSRTVDQNFKNELNQAIGISNMAERYNRATDTIAIKSERDNAEWEMMKAVGYTGDVRNKNSPAAKAMKAGFKQAETNLENAKKLGDLRAAQRAIMQYKENLVRQGINPDSPWYIKAIGDLMNQAAPEMQMTDPTAPQTHNQPFNFNHYNR